MIIRTLSSLSGTYRILWFGIALCAGTARAEVNVSVEHLTDAAAMEFRRVPVPAVNDAATTATFTLVEGERDRNGGTLDVLHDGRVPTGEDQPWANFFFGAGTDGGRLAVDLGQVLAVKRIGSYSWHPDNRAPQVYRLYAADGNAAGFESMPRRGTDPESCGWTLLARVDTRPADGDVGGPHAVMVADAAGNPLGRYRHLLFDISRTADQDPFGNTFFNEIDATDAPDLAEWTDAELRPVVQAWYPKLVAMLPSDGFVAPTNLTLRFRNDMGDTPASAGGGRINMNSDWFRQELQREARGSVVHEMVHVVQNYGRARRTNPNATRTPGWLVEGIADYIRWFLYEPETQGAEITARNLERARYDASYRITGNFLNWVTEHYDREIVRKLNGAAREGEYSDEVWKEWTGKTLVELGDAWKREHEARLANRAE